MALPPRQHLPDVAPCPHLPPLEEIRTAAHLKTFGPDRGDDFYVAALEGAQSLWRQGLPAQAILQLNRAFASDPSPASGVLTSWPPPYLPLAHILQHHRPSDFLGNPRRHFQHLATRMVEPRKDLRTWRAWACWAISCRLLPHLPADEEQIAKEGIREPAVADIRTRLAHLGLPGEREAWERALPSK
ncbi:MAG: hypothetical protein AAF191_19180 [Verrucomicrobiota bacterium]